MSVQETGAPSAATRSRWLVLWEALVIFAGYSFYEEIRGRVGGSTAAAARHASQVVRVEKWLHIYVERSVQHHFDGAVHFLQFWDIYYGTVHFVMPVVALVWLYFKCPERYRRWRDTLAVLTVLSIIGFAFYPLMPPRLMPGSYGFFDSAARYGGMGIFDKGGMRDVENLYAAMPSLHLGWSTWSALALFVSVRRPWVRVLVWLDPLLTLFTVVVTGNHWVLDAVGGWLWLGAAYVIVAGIERLRADSPFASRSGPPSPQTLSGAERGAGVTAVCGARGSPDSLRTGDPAPAG